MKKFQILSLILITFLAGSFKASVTVKADKTVIYIVRHGEKDLSDPKNPNPELSEKGRERASALAKRLKSQKFSAVFSTQYKRTMNTVAPIARRHSLPIEFYDPKNPKALADLVQNKYKNRKVIIAGHSNTVLELVEAFNLKRPVPQITEDDYDLLFKITVRPGGSELDISRYGEQHHTTELPFN